MMRFDTSAKAALLTLIAWAVLQSAACATPGEAAIVNNQAVEAISKKNMVLAVQLLEYALTLDPSNKYARANLGIAYNNMALSKPLPVAIKYLHKSLYYAPQKLALANLDEAIRNLKMNPKSFDCRVKLGNKALAEKDYEGAVVEYQAALKIKSDPAVSAKLAAVPHPVPAAASPGLKVPGGGLEFVPYMSALDDRIKLHWHPPNLADGKSAIARFKVDKNGNLSSLTLFKSTGIPLDDKAALVDAVTKAAPFARLPNGAPDKVDVEFTFDMDAYVQSKAARTKYVDEHKKGIASAEATYGPDSEEVLTQVSQLGLWQKQYGFYDDAIANFQRVVSAAEKANSEATLADSLDEIADVYFLQDKVSEAAPYMKRSMEIEERTLKPDDPMLLKHMELYYKILYKNGQTVEAQKYYDLLRDARNRSQGKLTK